MKINYKDWKAFTLGGESGLFVIKKGKRLTAEKQTSGLTPYIGAIDSNNGVSNYIGQCPIHEGNTISLSYNGSVGEAFYQPVPFWATDDVNVLYLKPDYGTLDFPTAMFICTILKREKYRFSYGRKWALDSMNSTEIKLPIDSKGNPDWEWMRGFIDTLHSKPLKTRNQEHGISLKPEEWREFKVGDILDDLCKKSYSSIPDKRGSVPFVTSSSKNNGVVCLVGEDESASSCLTVSTNGECFDCFYQPSSFCVSSDVEVLGCRELNKYNALFLCTIMRLEKRKWNYGRKPKDGKVFGTTIRLPATSDGKPDWQWMEDYIKTLPYGDRL